MTELVKLEIEHGLARITLARPEAGNAMSQAFIERFATVCEAVAADASVRAVLLAAEGKNFCVGGDINAFASEANPGSFIEQIASRLHDGIKQLARIDAPLVVAVRGAAAGAGLSLVAAADIAIAGENANFTLAYLGIGLTSDGGATWTLPRVIGLRRTQEMAYLNRRVFSAEALDWGLVTRVVADDIVEEEALAVARQLAAGPTRAIGQVKRLLGQTFAITLDEQLDQEARLIGAALHTSDAQGAVKAFLAREKPVFTGS